MLETNNIISEYNVRMSEVPLTPVKRKKRGRKVQERSVNDHCRICSCIISRSNLGARVVPQKTCSPAPRGKKVRE